MNDRSKIKQEAEMNEQMASEKQVQYMRNLAAQRWWYEDAVDGATLGHQRVAQSAVVELLGNGTTNRVNCISLDSTMDARYAVGRAVVVAAREWLRSMDWHSVSRRVASTMIDALRAGGIVVAYIAAQGGNTVEQRAEFIRNLGAVQVSIERYPKADFILLQ